MMLDKIFWTTRVVAASTVEIRGMRCHDKVSRRLRTPMPEMTSSAVSVPDDASWQGRLLWLVAAPAGTAALLFAVTAGYLWAGGANRSELVLIVAFLAGVVLLTVVAGRATGTIRRLDERPAPLRTEVAEARTQAASARADLADARAEAIVARTDAIGFRAAAQEAQAEIEALKQRV